MGRLFGTDGIRGVAGVDLTDELMTRVAIAATRVFVSRRKKLLIGRDTRISGPSIETTIANGFTSQGWNVVSVGVIPTPGLATLCKRHSCHGVVISASHNPVEYNGVKYFSPLGEKLTDEEENLIESKVNGLEKGKPTGFFTFDHTLSDHYESELARRNILGLTGKKIIIDCAYGATYGIAPRIFKALGAEVIAVGNLNDGNLINVECGATHPEVVAKLVKEHGAFAGFSFDGDGDRCIACDENGNIVDGDKVMGILAKALKAEDRLPNNVVVATVMSNGGLEDYLKKDSITLERTKVGDRYVYERMKETGSNLGGEQSGHIIIRDRSTTGDGILTALSTLKATEVLGKSLSELASEIPTYPQVLINVKVRDKNEVLKSGVVDELNELGHKRFDGSGRILIRPSGTEPKIRVMTESPDEALCKTVAEESAKIIKDRFGA
ncbi:MAG TPA: phosphoglucosamine mutase [Caldisericia bacterium]|nr:phosphoglucosamine mutase [Caldisericia bacterium]HPF49165.1 phosphoglucosamine mutase [Caldisericia bacterium]HPI82971.1 phosphoglucosamine mutase [Caldisericia bacterium]HPQ92198.1 phosphoglucosamine mutase [Caldisericia bacterium]HRV74704.1 phosphoglucosamine mutase [Caldisericia bacterium]